MILANKNHVHRRDRIGFVSNTHKNQTIFVKGTTLHVSPRNKYKFCYKFRYITYQCPFKRYSIHKLIWVPKGTVKNFMQNDKLSQSIFEALKVKWVPKNHPFL